MLFSMYIIKDRRIKIASLIKNIKDEQEDLSTEKGRLNGFIYDIKLALKEFRYTFDSNVLENYDSILNSFLRNIANSTTGEIMKQHLDVLSETLDSIETDRYSNASSGSYRVINQRIISSIMPHINNGTRPFTIFDPECKDGILLKEAKNINTNAVLYGLEEGNNFAEKAKESVDRIIKGKLKGTRISNDAFDMVYCVTHITTELQDNMSCGAISKVEKMHIINMLKYLRSNGVIMIAIPYYRMHKDICTMLSKQLTKVSVIKGMGDDEEKGILYIVGQKCKSKEIDEQIYESLRKCYNYNNVKYIHEVEISTFNLPNMAIDIDIFKGSVLDTNELLNIVQTSGCVDAFFERQKVKKIHENTIRPLLPFNVGQIGLVLTSGCLDGIIDEGDNHYHLVKGRVSKKTETERTTNNGVVEQTEVISNRVEINVILPNGDFKTLA